MGYLTDRTLTTGITINDLFHIVNPSDLSQNPAGSSYKANIGQLFDLLQTIQIVFYYKPTKINVSSETITTDYNYYGVIFSGNCDVTLPDPTGIDGFSIIVKDEKGNAGTYRIRVNSLVGNIDNNSYIDMNLDNISLTFLARDNNWWII